MSRFFEFLRFRFGLSGSSDVEEPTIETEEGFEDIAETDKGREISYNVFLTQFQNSRSEADKALIAASSAGMGFLLVHLSNPDRKLEIMNTILGFAAVICFAVSASALIVGFRMTSSYLNNNIRYMRYGEDHVNKAIEIQFTRMQKLDKFSWSMAGLATGLAIMHFGIYRWDLING